MKKVISVLVLLILVVGLFACGCAKKTMKTNCKVCGKEATCYQVTYHPIGDESSKEHYWVCSKDCEKFLDQIAIMAGSVKE